MTQHGAWHARETHESLASCSVYHKKRKEKGTCGSPNFVTLIPFLEYQWLSTFASDYIRVSMLRFGYLKSRTLHYVSTNNEATANM